MNKFLTYEISLTLKKLGFNELCFKWYNKNAPDILETSNCKNSESWLNGDHCTAPLYQDVFDWFIEEHKFEGVVIAWKERGKIVWYYSAEPLGEPHRYKCYECSAKTKREAEIACIEKLIEKIKHEQNTKIHR